MMKFYYKAMRILFVLAILSFGKSSAQVSNYTFTQAVVPGAYNNLILTDTFQNGPALSFDFISGDIPFPNGFTFNYNCRTYDAFRVSNNGYLLLGVFGNPVITQTNAIANTSNIPAEAVIQPFGIDLTNSVASAAQPAITYGMDPTTTSGAFIIQFKDMARNLANQDRINFQIWLHPNGTVEFRYGNCFPSSVQNTTSSPTVGIKGGYTNDFIVRSVTATGPTANWSNSGVGSSIFSTSRYVGSGVSPFGSIYPLNNLVYTFNSNSCYNPTYESLPACTSFETEWILGTSSHKIPSGTWTKWPSAGQNGWFSNYENAGVSKWSNATLGLYSPSGATSSLHSARFHTYSLANGYYGDLDWHLDLSNCASATKELNFYYINNTSGADDLKVFLSTDGGASFTLLSQFAAQSTWSQQTINLGVINSTNAVIRFRGTSDGISQAGSDIGLDEVCVSGTGTTPTITTTPANSGVICKVGQGQSNITLSASGATNYKWSPVFGLNTTNGSSVIANPSTNTTYTVLASDANCVTTSRTITVEVSPTIQLQTSASPPSLCYGSTTTLTVTDSSIGTQFLPYGYCTTGPLSSLDEDCGNVNFAGINNTSPQNSLIGTQGTAFGVPSIYSDFTSTVSAGEVVTGGTYPLSVTVIDDGGTTFQNSFKVFMDYNRDGDFNDAGELIFTSGYNFGGSTQSGNVIIPSTAKAGITVMRVCVYETTPGNIIACGTPNSFGEVEDYSINIIKKPAISGAGSSYTWSPNTFLNTNSGASVTASNVTSNITYTLTATDQNGCSAISLRPVFVTSNGPLTTTNINGPNNICTGVSTTLNVTASGGTPPYSYVWNGQGVSGNGASISATPVTTSTYTVTVTDGCGANSTKTKTIIVSGAPVISASATPSSMCPGTSTTLTASGALSYSWSGGISSGVPFIPVSTSTYTVTGTSSNGCTSTKTVQVIVNPTPLVGANANPGLSVCSGKPVILNGAGTNSYTWSHSVVNGVSFIPSGTTTYTVTGTNSAGCTNTNTITITTLNNPTVSASKSPSFPTCRFVPITLNGSGANSYTWSGGVVNGNAFSPTSTTTYTVTGLSSNGCTNTATIQAIVYQLPNVSASASPSNSICLNESVTLNGSGANAYSWTGGVSNATAFSPTSTATYTVTGTAATGCTNTATQSVTVKTLPNVSNTIAPNDSICLNENITMNGTGAASYSWSAGVTNGAAFTPLSSTTYTITGTATNGCTNTATQAVVVKQLPTILSSASPSNSICLNKSVSLSGSGGASYVWTGGVMNATNFSPTATNTYTVTGTASNGCTNTSTETVTVKTLPTVSASASPNNSICLNKSVTLTGAGASTYAWTGGVIDGTSFSPTSTATYTVTGTASNACTNTAIQTVSIKALPTVGSTVSPSNSICLNESVTLNGNGATSYTWTGGINDGTSFSPTSTATYTVTGTASNACTNTATRMVTVKALPSINANVSPSNSICDGESALLSGSGGLAYTWTGGVINNTSFIPVSTNTYTVTGTASNACTNTSTVMIEVRPTPNLSLVVNPSAVVCENNSVKFTAGGANTYSWTGGVANGVSFNAAASNTYTVTGTNAQSCTATAIVNLLVNNSNELALSTSANNNSTTGTANKSMDHFDGAALLYTDINCKKIAMIDDGAGGNLLGQVDAQVKVESAVQTYNGQPYARRWYDIVPTNNGPAIVTLYFTQDDFNDYNAANTTYPMMPTITSNTDPKISNLRITKVDGVLGIDPAISITPSVNWNATTSYWELSFPVSSFSQFYLHTSTGNSPLPVELLSFTAQKNNNANRLNWTTETEQNNSHFNILKSTDNNNFQNIGTIYSKATNGNSSGKIDYTFSDKNIHIGNNFYKLEQVDIDGQKSYSKVLNLIWAEMFANIQIYPNPATSLFNIDFESEEEGAIMHAKLFDMSGRVVKIETAFATLGRNNIQVDVHNMMKGMYTLQLFEDTKLIYTTKLLKRTD